MDYSERVKKVLNSWADEAASIGDTYIDSNILGLTEVSINAHELNTLINKFKSEGGFNNRLVHKAIAITCARIIVAMDALIEPVTDDVTESVGNEEVKPVDKNSKKK